MKTAWFLLFFVASPVGDNPNGTVYAKRQNFETKSLCEKAVELDHNVIIKKDNPEVADFSTGAVCIEGLLK